MPKKHSVIRKNRPANPPTTAQCKLMKKFTEASPAIGATTMTGQNTILLVDADGDCENLVAEVAARAGRLILLAKTSREAFRIVEAQLKRLEVVIVDVDPGAHGLALLEAISGRADRPPIIVITALEEGYMHPIAMEHGAAICLGKPITASRLRDKLNRIPTKCLTSDRWGNLVPAKTGGDFDLRSCFRPIGTKLSPIPPPATVHSRTRHNEIRHFH